MVEGIEEGMVFISIYLNCLVVSLFVLMFGLGIGI